MTRRAATLSTAAALAMGLGLGATQLTVPYVALGPGPVTDTLGSVDGKPLIEVTGRRTYPARGHLDLTTVNVYPELDLATALRYWFDRTYAVVPREIVFPPDQTPRETEEQNKREMTESQEHAITAALRELEVPVATELVVGKVVEGSGAAAAGIAVGDVVTGADGEAVPSFEALQAIIGRREPGRPVRVTYRRGAASRTVAVVTRPADGEPGRPVIGVELDVRQSYPFKVTIRLEDVGGPSAGLMFALGIVDLLTPGDLTGGRHVAGSGTIDDDGRIGAIGGIQQKLVAAKEAGAGWFLVPAGNWDDATAARPDGLELHRVGTLDEALAALRQIAAPAR